MLQFVKIVSDVIIDFVQCKNLKESVACDKPKRYGFERKAVMVKSRPFSVLRCTMMHNPYFL